MLFYPAIHHIPRLDSPTRVQKLFITYHESFHHRTIRMTQVKFDKSKMANLTNPAVPNSSNPSSLKPRYEIRKLEAKHLPFAVAIVAHSHGFHSSVWQYIWPDRLLGRWTRSAAEALEYLVAHQIDSGLSYGVFDTQYVYQTAEAEEAGGKVFWKRSGEEDEEDVEKSQGREVEGERMLRQMDFPLVSVALSYDGFVPLEPEKMKPLLDLWPEFTTLYGTLASRDPRPPESWKPTQKGQVLMRNATSTRHDYEGQGIMAATARWLRREAAAMGFRGIQIECIASAVTHMWSDGVELPSRAKVVSEFECETLEVDGEKPFWPARQRVTKCWVDLVPDGE
jgi:hypothetical protein